MPKSRISNIVGTSGFSKSPSFRLFNCVGITAAIGLAALPAFLMLGSVVSSGMINVHAETTETLGASANITSTLGLSANSISMNISPSSNGAVFKTGKTVATVSTNNETGYTLYLSDGDGDNALKHANLASAAIVSTSTEVTGMDMPANTWGYSLGTSEAEEADETDNVTNLGLAYAPIPTVRTMIKKTDVAVSVEPTAVTFGVKVNTEIPSGVYSDQVSITAIPNYSSAAYPQSTLWLNSEGVQISTLQEMNADICASVPTPAVAATGTEVPEITLTDTRDGNSYKVRKLADGNCWMVESLKIAGTDETHPRVLTSADSNVAADFELPAIVELGATENSTTAAYVSGGGTGGKDNDTGISGVNGTVLYNFYAATAGSGGSLKSGNAPQDICPKGWHLPNNDGNASWNKLLHQGQGIYEITTDSDAYSTSKVSWGTYAGISTATSNPAGLQLTGLFWGSKLQGTAYGNYWSRTAYSADSAYNLGYGSSNVYLRDVSSKGRGRGVRCVANEATPANPTYLQEVNACPGSLPEGTQYTLKDSRDNKEYTVARLADGNCWMTKNLNLAGGTTITSVDSHVAEDYTLPVSDTEGFTDHNTAYVYNASDDTSKCNTEGCGGYYSWRAATAGTGTTATTSGDAAGDICPKGWHLPTRTEFDGITSYKSTFNPVLASHYNNATLDGQGLRGYYWSSTAYNVNNAYRLYVNSGVMEISSYNGKLCGNSVRCVFGS